MKSELRTQYGVLSLESETFSLDIIVGSTRKLLVDFIKEIRGVLDVASNFGSEQVNTFSFVKSHSLERDLKKSNYTSLMMLTSYVPPGMKVEWLKYLDALAACQDISDGLLKDTLKPALDYFSVLLGSPDRLQERSPTNDLSKIKTHERAIENSKKLLKACYSDTSVETKRPFGDVFKRNGDWVQANEALQRVTERLANVSPKEVLDVVQDLSDVLDRLALRLSQSPDLYQVSGITSKLLADTCMQLALEVEFYAAHVFIVRTASAAMTDTNTKLTEILLQK